MSSPFREPVSLDFKLEPFSPLSAPLPHPCLPAFVSSLVSALRHCSYEPRMQPEGPREHPNLSSAQSPPLGLSCSPWPIRPHGTCPHHQSDLIAHHFPPYSPWSSRTCPSFSLTQERPASRPFYQPSPLPACLSPQSHRLTASSPSVSAQMWPLPGLP